MNDYLQSVQKQFAYYKWLGEQTFAQVPDDALFRQHNEASNSIALIVQHLAGNMLSRWTDFLSTDGEKEWRNRDAEFEIALKTREELLALWQKGWDCLFDAINALRIEDLDQIIYIRNQGHTVMEAINRQLAHYPYHVGQIVYIGKMLAGDGWQSLSIPKGNSAQYNHKHFTLSKERKHFTDDLLKGGE